MDLNASILRVLGGDLDSFRGIVESYQVAVANFVAVSFPRQERVDELVQEIFVRAFRRLATYEPDQPFWPWVKGIARNVIHEELRVEQRRARERHAFAELMLLRKAEGSIIADDVTAQEPSDRLHALRECLKKHPVDGARLLQWFYLEGLSSDKIGARMGCGGSAVRNALMRTRQALRDCVLRKLQAQTT